MRSNKIGDFSLRKFKRVTLFFIFLFISQLFPQKLIVGYYPDGLKSSLPTSNIQFENLTHIIHSFAWPTSSGGIELYSNMLDQNLNSKVHEAGKKILIAFGGAGQSQGFGPMVIDSSKRANFINNVYDFLTTHNYDGIDIDWEFPENELEKKGLTQLVKGLREKFDVNNPSLLISMAVNSSNWGGQHFEFEIMEQYLNWFAVMGYDISGGWSSISGHNAPLFRGSNDWSWNDGYNYLHSTRSISKKKILLGLPFYGKQFNSTDLYKNFTKDVTHLRYNQIMLMISLSGWEYFWDNEAKVSYLLNKERSNFITYDDTNSVREKVEYAIDKNVAGVMIWALGQDVIGESQPLLEMISNIINIATDIESISVDQPKDFKLYNNYPHPFNPKTTIQYDIAKSSSVKINIYNSIGCSVKTFVNENQSPGSYKVVFDSKEIASGIYLYDLITNESRITKTMVLL